MWGVVGFVCLHNSAAAQISIAKAESNPVLIELLGSPLKTGWLISGSISVHPEPATRSSRFLLLVQEVRGRSIQRRTDKQGFGI